MNSRRKTIAWLGGIAGCGMVAVLLFVYDPGRVPIYPICPFHRITGLDCPGCGGLRAVHQLLHGNLVAAIHFNALLILSLPLFAGLGLRFIWNRTGTGQSIAGVRPVWLWLYAAAWIAFGVLRNLPAPAFAAFGAHAG